MERLVVEEVEDQHESASQALHQDDAGDNESSSSGVGLFGIAGSDAIVTRDLRIETKDEVTTSTKETEATLPASVDSTRTEIGNELQEERKQEAVLDFLDRLEQQPTPSQTPSDEYRRNATATSDEQQCMASEDTGLKSAEKDVPPLKLPNAAPRESCDPADAPKPDGAEDTINTVTAEEGQLDTSLNDLKKLPPKSAVNLVERCFQLPPTRFKSLYANPRPYHFVVPKNVPPSPFATLREIFEQREILETERRALRTQQTRSTSPDGQSLSLSSLREELRTLLQDSEWHREAIRGRLLSSHQELSLTLTASQLAAARALPLRSASTDPAMTRNLSCDLDAEQPHDDAGRAAPFLPALPQSPTPNSKLGGDAPRARSTSPALAAAPQVDSATGGPLPVIGEAPQHSALHASPSRQSRRPMTRSLQRLRASPARRGGGPGEDSAVGWEARGRSCGERQSAGTVRALVQHLSAWRGGAASPALEQALLKLFVLFPGDVWAGGEGIGEAEAEAERQRGRTADAAVVGLLLGMKLAEEVMAEAAEGEAEAEAAEEAAEEREEQQRQRGTSKVLGRERAEAALQAIKAARRSGVNPTQPAGSTAWSDFCAFLRRVARMATAFVPKPREAEGPEAARSEEHKVAVGVQGEGGEQAEGSVAEGQEGEGKGGRRHSNTGSAAPQDKHGGQTTGIGHVEQQPTQAEFEEVKQLFRWFQGPTDFEYCDLSALSSALYMNGFSHRAVSSLIQEAREAARQNPDPEKRDRVSRFEFAVILSKFRRHTEPTRAAPLGLSNMVRVIVVQGGSSERTLPALKVLGNKVFPYLVDLAVEMGGILEFQALQLADYTQLIRNLNPGDTESLAAQAAAQAALHQAMTAEELVAYASGECRAACKHVWFLFLIDDKVSEPCLPDRCSEEELEEIEEVLQARGVDAALLKSCYALDVCLKPDQYRLVTDDLAALKRLHDAVFAPSADLQAECHLWKRTPAYRVLAEAFEVGPVFVMVREDCQEGEAPAPELLRLDKELLARVPESRLLWYRLGSEAKRRNRKAEEQALQVANKMRKVGRRIAMLGTIEASSPLDMFRAQKPSSAESAESKMSAASVPGLVRQRTKTSMLDVLKKPTSPKSRSGARPGTDKTPQVRELMSKWGEMLEHDAYASLSSLVATTMADTESFSEQKVHESHLKRILFTVEGDRQSIIHPAQDFVVHSLAEYLTHTVDDIRRPDSVTAIPLKLESRVTEGLRCMRSAAEHQSKFWSFPSEETDFPIILDDAMAQEAMLAHSMAVKQQASGVMKQEWQSMTWPERLAVVQVVEEYQGLLATLDSLKPTAKPDEAQELRKDAPVFVIGPPGSGRSAELARALKASATTMHFMSPASIDIAPAADGQVSGVCFLRVVGASSKAMDGRSLLRSLVLQIREHMEPDKHLQEAIPGALVQLEEELLSSLPMATSNCPVVLVVDGLDKLAAHDPILTLRWLPKKLPSNVRVLVSATEDLIASGAAAGFDAGSIVRMRSPDENAAAAYAKDFFSLSGREPEPEDLANILGVFRVAPSLHLLALCCQYARHWSSVLRLRVAHPRYRTLPLFASEWDNLELNPEYFSHTAMALLSMLVLGRHGLSELHMRLAVSVLNSSDSPGSSPLTSPLHRTSSTGTASSGKEEHAELPDMARAWEFKASAELASIRWMVSNTVSGKSSLMQLSDPSVANAVRNSAYFQDHKQEICEALIAVISSPDSARSIPMFQQVASLPALQQQLAAIVGHLPVEGHSGVGWTLLSSQFIKTKIEAGLLEDLVRDFQECFLGAQSGLFALAPETLSLLLQRLQAINYNLDWFVKPFHWALLDQLITKNDGEALTLPTNPTAQSGPPLEAMWTMRDDAEEEAACRFFEHPRPTPRVACSLRLPHRKKICSCDVFSSSACIRYAVGFEDGGAIVWDGLFGEVDRVLDMGDDGRVMACKFVHGPADSEGGGAVAEMVPRFLVCATVNGQVLAFSHGAWKEDFRCSMQKVRVGAAAEFPTHRAQTAKSTRPNTSKTAGSGKESPQQSAGETSPLARATRRASDAAQVLALSGSTGEAAAASPPPQRRGSTVAPAAHNMLPPEVTRAGSARRRGSLPRKAQFPPVGLGALTAMRRPSQSQEESEAPLTCVSTSVLLDNRFLIAAGAQDGALQVWLYAEEATAEGGLTRTCSCTDIKREHSAAVNCIAFAPDRWWMVSASADKTIRIWNCHTKTGRLQCVEVLDQGSACFWCDFDGRKILCSGFGFIRQFVVTTHAEEVKDSSTPAEEAPARQAISDSGSEPKVTIRPRGSAHFGGPQPQQQAAPAKAKKRHVLKRIDSVLGKNVSVPAALPRTSSTKSTSSDSPLPEPGVEPQRVFSSPERMMMTVRASKLENCVRMEDGKLMMVCCDSTMMIWDLESDNAQSLELSSRPTCCAASRDGKMVLVATEDHNLRVWENNGAAPKRLTTSWARRRSSVAAEALRRGNSGLDSNDLIRKKPSDFEALHDLQRSSSDAESLQAPTQATGLIKSEASLSSPVTSISISHDGMIALSVGEGRVELWEMGTGRPAGTLGINSDFGQVRHAAFCPRVPPNHVMHDVAASLFMVIWTSHRINLWKADMLSAPILAVGIHELDIRVARFVGTDPVIVTGSLDKSVRVWRILSKSKREKGEEEEPLGHSLGGGHAFDRLGSAPEHNLSAEVVGAVRAQKFARQVSERVRTRCCLHGMHEDSVLHVAGDHHARYIASASADRSFAVFDLEHHTNKPLWRGTHMAYVQAVEFSKSGTMLASVGGDRMCRVWNVSSGECTGIFKASGALTKVSFSPCETFVAAGGLAGSLGVWDVATGKLAPGRPHPVMCNVKCSVTSLSWVPGSLGLLVAGTDGEVWSWDVARGAFIGGFVNKSPANHGDGQPELFENPGITCAQLMVSDKLHLPAAMTSKPHVPTMTTKRSTARLKRKSTKRPSEMPLQPLPGTAVLVCGDVRGQVHIVMAPGLEAGRASKPSGRAKHYYHHHHTHSVRQEAAVVDPLHYLEKRKKSGAIALVLKTAFGIRGQLKQSSRAASAQSKLCSPFEVAAPSGEVEPPEPSDSHGASEPAASDDKEEPRSAPAREPDSTAAARPESEPSPPP